LKNNCPVSHWFDLIPLAIGITILSLSDKYRAGYQYLFRVKGLRCHSNLEKIASNHLLWTRINETTGLLKWGRKKITMPLWPGLKKGLHRNKI